MTWFYIGFPLLMILFPAVFMTLIRFNANAVTHRRRANQLTAWLWLSTIAAVGVWYALHHFTTPMIAVQAWVLFFPLFFGFCFPLMRAKNPDWVSMPPPDLPRRAASLVPRVRQSPVAGWVVPSVWLLWVIGALAHIAVIDWSQVQSAWWMVRFELLVPLPPIIAAIAVRLVQREPETLDPAGSPELIALYDRRRRQRAWMFIVFACFMIAFSAMLGLSGWIMLRQGVDLQSIGVMHGIVGGIAGTAIGIAGGVAGTLSSIQAARINAKLRELNSRDVSHASA